MARKRKDPNAGPPELGVLLQLDQTPKARPARAEPEQAAEGLRFRIKGEEEEQIVGPKCTTNEGHWICTTHGIRFGNQMAKDGHIGRFGRPKGRHVLAWHCVHHGPEVP